MATDNCTGGFTVTVSYCTPDYRQIMHGVKTGSLPGCVVNSAYSDSWMGGKQQNMHVYIGRTSVWTGCIP